MDRIYEVFLGQEPTGKVQLICQGLYYRVICRCIIPDGRIFRLYVSDGAHSENLGVLMPDGDGCLLDRRIPAKRIGEEPKRFYLYAGTPCNTEGFEVICPEEPFLYIDRLKNAFLESRQGSVGIVLKKFPEAE